MEPAYALPYFAGGRPATDQPDPPGLRQGKGTLAVVGRIGLANGLEGGSIRTVSAKHNP
jgi:hypothetical protein